MRKYINLIIISLVVLFALSSCGEGDPVNFQVKIEDGNSILKQNTKIYLSKYQCPDNIIPVIYTTESVNEKQLISFTDSIFEHYTDLIDGFDDMGMLIIVSRNPQLVQMRLGSYYSLAARTNGLCPGKEYYETQQQVSDKGLDYVTIRMFDLGIRSLHHKKAQGFNNTQISDIETYINKFFTSSVTPKDKWTFKLFFKIPTIIAYSLLKLIGSLQWTLLVVAILVVIIKMSVRTFFYRKIKNEQTKAGAYVLVNFFIINPLLITVITSAIFFVGVPSMENMLSISAYNLGNVGYLDKVYLTYEMQSSFWLGLLFISLYVIRSVLKLMTKELIRVANKTEEESDIQNTSEALGQFVGTVGLFAILFMPVTMIYMFIAILTPFVISNAVTYFYIAKKLHSYGHWKQSLSILILVPIFCMLGLGGSYFFHRYKFDEEAKIRAEKVSAPLGASLITGNYVATVYKSNYTELKHQASIVPDRLVEGKYQLVVPRQLRNDFYLDSLSLAINFESAGDADVYLVDNDIFIEMQHKGERWLFAKDGTNTSLPVAKQQETKKTEIQDIESKSSSSSTRTAVTSPNREVPPKNVKTPRPAVRPETQSNSQPKPAVNSSLPPKQEPPQRREPGYTVEVYGNGNRYSGYVNEYNQRHGKGTYEWANGNKYTGNWINGKGTGQGIYYSREGWRFEGSFVDLKFHGNGIYYHKNGKAQKGVWSNGVLQNLVK